MKVVLLEKVRNLGELGEVVEVKSGYGRNYLIPQGKAVPATEERLAEVEAKRAELEKAAQEQLEAAQERAKQFADIKLVIVRKAMEEGKLFGSVSVKDIVEALAEQGMTVEKREIILQEGPFHYLGEHSFELHLHGDVSVTVSVVIEAEG